MATKGFLKIVFFLPVSWTSDICRLTGPSLVQQTQNFNLRYELDSDFTKKSTWNKFWNYKETYFKYSKDIIIASTEILLSGQKKSLTPIAQIQFGIKKDLA